MIWLPHAAPSPLIKIPLLLYHARLAYIVYTPPTPPAKAGDMERFGNSRRAMSLYGILRAGGFANKIIHGLNAACESAVILATAYPDLLPFDVVGLLVHKRGGEQSIRITPIWLLGITLGLIGIHIRLACYRELGRHFTWELSVKDDHRLITTGPYGVVRHPAYTGSALLAIGSFVLHMGAGSWYWESGWLETLGGKILTAAWLSWSAYIPLMLINRVKREDRVLRKHFGHDWDVYARRVPYRLIPGVY